MQIDQPALSSPRQDEISKILLPFRHHDVELDGSSCVGLVADDSATRRKFVVPNFRVQVPGLCFRLLRRQVPGIDLSQYPPMTL